LMIAKKRISSYTKVRQIGHVSGGQGSCRIILSLLIFFMVNILSLLPMETILIYSLAGGSDMPYVADWMAVLILPINSIINPIFYTFRTMLRTIWKSSKNTRK